MDTTTITLRKSQARIQLDCPTAIATKTPIGLILRFPAFVHWLDELDVQMADKRGPDIAVSKIAIQSVDVFRPGTIGFLKFVSEATHVPDGARVPGIVFLRGGAVAMLVILRTQPISASSRRVPSWQDTDCVVLVEQPRLAVPDFSLRELPAGMLDGGTGEFAGTAARELREETGLSIGPEELIDITPDGEGVHRSRGLYPSPGACDEFIRFFACEKHVAQDELDKLRGKLGGLRDEGELITLRLVRLCDLWKESRDMQTVAAAYLWDRHNLKDAATT